MKPNRIAQTIYTIFLMLLFFCVPKEAFCEQKYFTNGTFIWNDMKITIPESMTAVILDDARLTIYTKYKNRYIALAFGKFTNDQKHIEETNIKSNKTYIIEESREFNFKGYPCYNISFLVPRKNENGLIEYYEYANFLYIEKKYISITYLESEKGGFSLFKPIVDNISFVK
jgi:hypothetical protein